jgi:CheY-like chemotaxis protein
MADRVEPNPVQPSAVNPQRQRILVVEDYASMARMMSRFLTREGFDVKTASGMADAAGLIERESFDILISDLNLPDGSGFDLMHRARKTQSITGIAITGANAPDDIQRCREAGFAAHLTKPVELDHLLQVIKEIAAV